MAQRTCYRVMRSVYNAATHPLHFRTNSLSLTSRLMSTATANDTQQSEEQRKEESSPEKDKTLTKIADLEATLKEQSEKFTSQIKELDDKYKRSLAETENVRRRMQKQVDDAKMFGIQGFCKDLLEVADILSTATENAPADQLNGQNPPFASLFEGLTMTEKQLQKVFSTHKLHIINPAEGEKFDPNFHEALFENPVPGKEGGTVAVVTKVGYKLHERTLRPALVGVFKAV